MSSATDPEVFAVEDEDFPHPVPSAWRPLLTDVVRCLVGGDYGLIAGGAGVEPLPADLRADIRIAIESFGTPLAELPERAWEHATAQWYTNHWVVCVNLWTESGPTELMLAGRIVVTANGPKFTVYLVHAP